MKAGTESDKSITLIIETAIGGGSLALFEDDRLIDFWNGSAEISKSEDVLDQIDVLLIKNGINKTCLKSIKCAKEQGSLTGLKIGLAIAKGLCDALQISLQEVSTGAALLAESSLDKVLIVLPVGKNLFFSQIYQRKEDEKFKLVWSAGKSSTGKEFQSLLDSFNDGEIIFHKKSFEIWKNIEPCKTGLNIKIAPANIASLIGKNKCV